MSSRLRYVADPKRPLGGCARLILLTGVAIALAQWSSPAFCAGSNTEWDYVFAAQQDQFDRVNALKMSLVVWRTSYHDPPLRLTRETLDEGFLTWNAKEIRGVYRYVLYFKRGLSRFDKQVEELIAVLDNGRKLDWDSGMSNWRRSRDSRVVRAVHVGQQCSYVHEDSDETFYEAVEDRYAFGLRKGLSLENVAEKARALVGVSKETIDGKILHRVSMPSENGYEEKVAWLDPAIGFQPVRVERWVSPGNGKAKVLARSTTIGYREYERGIWLAVELTTRSWNHSRESGKRMVSEEVDIKADVDSIEVNKEIGDETFTFTGMGIDPRANIYDTRNDLFYQVAGPSDLADVSWDTGKPLRRTERPANVPEVKIVAPPEETDLTQPGIPHDNAEEVANKAFSRLLAHVVLGIVIAAAMIAVLRFVRARGIGRERR